MTDPMGPGDDPAYPGVILLSQGQTDEAEAVFRRVLDDDPGHTGALHMLAVIEYARGGREAAADLLARATAQPGADAAIHDMRGRVLMELGRAGDAEAAMARAAIEIGDDPTILTRLGEAMRAQGRNADAEAVYRRALERQPDALGAGNGLGVVLDEQGKTQEAEKVFRATMEAAGETPELLYNLGGVLKDQHRADAAAEAYRRAIELDPGFAEAHVQLAFALLLQGDFEAGWPEYEWRWQVPTFTSPPRAFDRPEWTGDGLAGRTLLLHAEQGFGDTLQFARYATLGAALGGTIVLECQPGLKRLMGTLSGVDAVIARGEALPAFDCHAALLSMPLLLKTKLETVPADVPYLAPEPRLLDKWRDRLADATGLKVGIAWQGTAEKRGTIGRACPLSAFRPLIDDDTLSLYAIQKDIAETDRPLPDGITDLSGDLDDFATTAAILANLDLVVSIDTAVAHLAGALGRPTWLLLATAGDWRWLMGRDDNPWYPAMRLFRQRTARDWDGLLARVAAEIGGFRPA